MDVFLIQELIYRQEQLLEQNVSTGNKSCPKRYRLKSYNNFKKDTYSDPGELKHVYSFINANFHGS